MLMLENAREVQMDELNAAPTPPAHGRWKPIPHARLVRGILDAVRDNGLTVRSHRFSLNTTGQQLFGTLDFEPTDGFPKNMTPSLGYRHSNDKEFAVGLAFGSRVLVCSNGIFTGEMVDIKMHTSGLNLDEHLHSALSRFRGSIFNAAEMHDELRGCSIDDEAEAHDLIMKAFRRNVLAWSYAPKVVKEYFEPRHEEFEPRNRWSLYNSFTQTMKESPVAGQLKGFNVLNGILRN